MATQASPRSVFGGGESASESSDASFRFRIRPAAAGDSAAQHLLLGSHSCGQRQFRLLGCPRVGGSPSFGTSPSAEYFNDLAFVVAVHDLEQERIVAVSSYRTDPVTLDCECVVCVRDEARHEGLESLLMKHLIEVARTRGIRSMESASASHPHMRHLADVLGFTAAGDADDSNLCAHKLLL